MRHIVTPRNIVLISVLCGLVHVARVYFHGFIEDPDVGSFIILSQSFWSGDLFYYDFFDPKLPHILPVYSLSLVSGSVGGHLLITFFCICATGFIINLSGKNSWGGVLYICLVLISPGGATGHLAVFANFLVACSYYAMSKYRSANQITSSRQIMWFWLVVSSLLSGWAIGLRPNYGFALVPLSIWFISTKKLTTKAALVWLFFCLGTIVFPVFLTLERAGMSPLELLQLFRAWNLFFYEQINFLSFWAEIATMYSHPIGPISLGLLVGCAVAITMISAFRDSSVKPVLIVFVFLSLWLSHFISHTYNHYVLMDLLILGIFASSIKIQTSSFMILAIVSLLWVILVLSPTNGHSEADSSMIDNRRKILMWVAKTKPMKIVSPMWLTPHWITKSRVPTKGIHPEWSIGLLDRYKFKDIDVVRRFGLDIDWASQCKIWEGNSEAFIGTQEIYDKCKFDGFNEVSQFSKYQLKVWVKE